MKSIQFKSALFLQAKSWETIPITELKKRIFNIPEKDFRNGNTAVYLHSRIYDCDKFSYWTCVDVESEQHDNISKNIAIAKDLLSYLVEKGLDKNLTILLTGRGFRFVWPYYVSQEYKRGYAAWCRNLDAIELKTNAFFRMLGYRGNKKQAKSKKVKHVHIHKLNDIHDIWFFSVDDYQNMVKGRPSYNQSLGWLDGILPKSEIPFEWKKALDDWKNHEELKACAIVPEYFYNDRLVNFVQISQYLTDQGIDWKEKTIADYWIWKLKSCPECARTDNTPYITSKGRLKCFHVSCRAGERDLEGKIIGLGAHEYIEGYESSKQVKCLPLEEIEQDLSIYRTLQEARESLKGMYEEKPENLLVTADPGVGKTHSIISQRIPECADKKILYASPTKKLNGQTYNDAEQIGRDLGIKVYKIEGRAENNCLQYSKAIQLSKQGFKPSVMLCPRCRDKETCKYTKQFEALKKKSGFFITTHAQLNYIKLDFDCVIIDEDPMPSFFKKEIIPIDSILKFQSITSGFFFEKLLRVASAMTPAAEKKGSAIRFYPNTIPDELGGRGKELWSFCEITETDIDHFYRNLVVYEQLEGETNHSWQWRLYDDQINYFALQWLLLALNGDNDAYIQVDAESINFVLSQKNIPDFKSPLVVLDGTSNKQEMDSLFDRDFEVKSGRVSLDSCTKTLIRRNLSKTRCKKIQDDQIEYLLKEAVASLRPEDKKILLATHQIIEKRTFAILENLLPGKELGCLHFYGNRGNNEFKKYDAVICFGSPGTNQVFRLDEAMRLFPNDHKERVKWFERVAEAELIQTVHRIRPVNGDKNIILVNRKWLPELGSLDFEMDKRKGSDKIINTFNTALERLEKFYLDYGFLSLQIGYLLQIGHTSKKSLIQKINTMVGSNWFLHLLDIYIGEETKKSRPLLLFSNKAYWSKLIEKLVLKHSAAIIEHRIHSKWSKGVGSIEAVERFFLEHGLVFNENNWRLNEYKQQ